MILIGYVHTALKAVLKASVSMGTPWTAYFFQPIELNLSKTLPISLMDLGKLNSTCRGCALAAPVCKLSCMSINQD